MYLVGLSYVSKLVPALIGIMFGVHYLFIGMGNKLAGHGMIETITAHSLSNFFQFYNSPIGAGLIMIPLSSMKKLMHGVK
jgi:POT family proton-dependent oligopeptide transporter